MFSTISNLFSPRDSNGPPGQAPATERAQSNGHPWTGGGPFLGRVRLQVLGGYRRVEHHDPTPSYLHHLAPNVTPLPSPSYLKRPTVRPFSDPRKRQSHTRRVELDGRGWRPPAPLRGHSGQGSRRETCPTTQAGQLSSRQQTHIVDM